MNCEMGYCIYNKDSKCLLRKTDISVLGMCEECTVISLDAPFLEAEKARQREELIARMEGQGK